MNWGDYLYYDDGKLYWIRRSKNGACQPGKEAEQSHGHLRSS